MELTKYHKVRTGVQLNAAPVPSDHRRAVGAYLRQTLMKTGLFDDVEVDCTDNLNNLVIAMCEFPPETSKEEVAYRLETLWQDNLRYGFWEAHTTLEDTDQVELEGTTRPSQQGHYVTVHILAKKAPVPAQRSPRS